MEQAPEKATERLSVAEAAQRIKRSWHVTFRLALTGQLDATNRDGKWTVTTASVDAYLARSAAAPQAA